LYHQFCKAVSEGKEIRVVFLDISKAFDRVWHKGLIYKLQKAGIKGRLLHWFIDYLHERFQRVIIKGEFSEWLRIVAGVPQGSVLGPLLFLIFINDITNVIEHCNIRMFADDTCLFVTVDNREEAAADLNNDLVNVQNWANQWLINFSPPKTESLTISNKANLNLHPALLLNNFPVKEVQFHKHLGVTFTQSLRWNKHIDEVCSKCYKKLDIMKHLKFKLDRKSLETIYMSFILPSLDYGDYLYAGTYDSDLCKLDRIHVEAMRNVTGATARSNIILLFEETGWFKLSDRRENHALCALYKTINGLSPIVLTSAYESLTEYNQPYQLRSQGKIPIPFARTESYKRSFFPDTIRKWNLLDNEIKHLPTYEVFKETLNKLKYSVPEILYYGARWASVHHARLRLGCSKINHHLFSNLHVVQSPACECGADIEDPIHFLFICPLFDI
jgi:hypothetical protein